jgi:hypothetical protein
MATGYENEVPVLHRSWRQTHSCDCTPWYAREMQAFSVSDALSAHPRKA